jgi:hypothetical protein
MRTPASTEAKGPLIFPHIPKTGGTALLYHFRQGLGNERVFILGPHNRVHRFWSGLPQWEELGPEGRADFSVVQGHRVTQTTLPQVGGAARLVAVLRHPVALTRSRFNHQAVTLAQLRPDRMLDAETFWKRDKGNTMCRLIIQLFPTFVEDKHASLEVQALSILRCFDYVGMTETLDADFEALFQDEGLPAETERRRVAEKKIDLPVTDAEIAARNPADMALYEALQVDRKGQRNPLGQDVKRRREILEQLQAAMPLERRVVMGGYRDLATALCSDLTAQAAIEALRSYRKNLALYPLALLETLQKSWDAYLPTLSDAAQAQVAKRGEIALSRMRKKMNPP